MESQFDEETQSLQLHSFVSEKLAEIKHDTVLRQITDIIDAHPDIALESIGHLVQNTSAARIREVIQLLSLKLEEVTAAGATTAAATPSTAAVSTPPPPLLNGNVSSNNNNNNTDDTLNSNSNLNNNTSSNNINNNNNNNNNENYAKISTISLTNNKTNETFNEVTVSSTKQLK